jgi:site-specific DNA-methyltransferase (adenine-specific)
MKKRATQRGREAEMEAKPSPSHKVGPATRGHVALDSDGADRANTRDGAPARGTINPAHTLSDPEARVYVGDCRELLPKIPEVTAGVVDLVFADPPFNWDRAYDKWNDRMPEKEYLQFTRDWLDLCIGGLRPGGALWVNIPDDWAAEIVVHLKDRGLAMENWCIWHYRFGQNTTGRYINSKVHALYFVKAEAKGRLRTWNPREVLEPSDRATTYFDPRTLKKTDGMPAGMRVPMDVWYGPYWGRIQGNNTERRGYHDNQLPEVYLERVIRSTSNVGDLVLDPFLGSGTTGVVAHALGRRFLGTEFSANNARSAFERMVAGPVRVGRGNTAGTAIHATRGASAMVKEKFASAIRTTKTS